MGEEIYIVWGETGMFDSHRRWPVHSFRGKAAAEKFRGLCQEEADGLVLIYGKWLQYMDPSRNTIHSRDPDFEMDWLEYDKVGNRKLGVRYTVTDLPCSYGTPGGS